MNRMSAAIIAFAFILGLAEQVWAGGARFAVRSGGAAMGSVPGIVVQPGSRTGRDVWPAYPNSYYYYAYAYYGYHPPLVIVVSPYHYSSYYLPSTVVVNAPFFCVLHQVGFVSRVGMLDHLSGTHKIPLETAASFCPESVGNCLFPSY